MSGRVWRAGTLTYTAGGLGLLFTCLLWGDFAWWMKERAIVPLGQVMLRQFGASDFIVGLLVGSIPAGVGLLLGPLVALRSDRHRGRWGRRIPYLLLPTPFVVAAMFGLAGTAPIGETLDHLLGASSPGVSTCRLWVFAFFWTAFELSQTTAQAVLGGLIGDVVPRALIGRFYGLFRAVGLVAAIIFNFQLIQHAETNYPLLLLGLGTFFGVSFTLMCLVVREGDYPPPPPAPSGPLHLRLIAPIRIYAHECFSQPWYLGIFAALTLGALCGGPVQTFSLYHAQNLGLDLAAYGQLLVITYSVSLGLSYPLGALADRIHPLRVGLVALTLYAVIMLWSGWGSMDPRLFSRAFVTHGVLMGCYITGTASLAVRLFPGSRLAQFSAAGNLVSSLGYVVFTPLLGAWLDHTGRIYRHVFLLSGGIAAVAAFAYFLVWRGLARRGGPEALPGDA